MEERRLKIEEISWSQHQAAFRFSLDRLKFSTSYWYPDVDLDHLQARFGEPLLERLFVHAALFEINKIASLRPRRLDLGSYARHHTASLERLWKTIFHRVWAQWRYENNLPHEEPVTWTSRPVEPAKATKRDRVSEELLLFCGGGKDSLVAMKLLERGNIPFATLAYTSNVYGPAAPQARLIDGLLDRCAPRRRHRQVVLDDFFDAPVLDLYGEALGVHTITAAETPSSIFAALPLLLDRGYRGAALGNEASANRGNLLWSATGEDVNHQWGKSLEAEQLMAAYVREALIEDIDVFSLLMPLHDVLIFELLRRDEEHLEATHSCNVRKPWCLRCPKCAYVWLNCKAHLTQATVDQVFPENLLEIPENEGFFRDMIGLGEHTPFECIGQIEESRLALLLCEARGLLGPRGTALARRLPPLDVEATLASFGSLQAARIPTDLDDTVRPQMREAEASARQRILAILGVPG